MRKWSLGAALVLGAASLGCTYTKEVAPATTHFSSVHSPNQQRLVAQPTTQAVQLAVRS